jgi:hypothetical protein
MGKPKLRPWSQGDDNGLCGLYATVNAIRWLWPELRKKDKQGDELINPLPNWLIREKLTPEQFRQLYLDGDELPLISSLVEWGIEWLRTNKGFVARVTYPYQLAPPSDKSTYWRWLLPLIAPGRSASINTVQRSTCTAIWLSSDMITVSPLRLARKQGAKRSQ